MSPLVSVIIVCRNPGPRLADAIASVRAQDLADRELVIVDGASTDGTSEWLQGRREEIDLIISEPDAGVYDAMNKGIRRARGEWILFLGADDRLAADDVLRRALPKLRTCAGDIAVGEARFDDGRIYGFSGPTAATRRNFVHHQAAFYRRSVFGDVGVFDTTLQLQADYDFNLRLLKAGKRFVPLSFRVADCASGGLSDAGAWRNYSEEIAVRHRHCPGVGSLLWDAGSLVRFARKKLYRSIARHA